LNNRNNSGDGDARHVATTKNKSAEYVTVPNKESEKE